MISAFEITKEIAETLRRMTGEKAFSERLSSEVYPSYIVQCTGQSGYPWDGGRQILRTVSFSIHCLPSRQRAARSIDEMVQDAAIAINPYFVACGRAFAPQGMSMEMSELGGEVKFDIYFSDLPPQPSDQGGQIMGSLDFGFKDKAA